MDSHTLLIVVTFLSTFITLTWFATGFFLRFTTRAAYEWTLCNALIAIQVGLYSWRGAGPDIVTYNMSDWSAVLSMLFLRRGIQSFAELKYTDRQQIIFAFFSLCGLTYARTIPNGQALAIVSLSIFWAFTFCMCAREGYQYMRSEFQSVPSLVTISPFLIMATFCTVRSVIVFFVDPSKGGDLRANNAFAAVFLMIIFVSCILINSAIAGMSISRLISRIRKLSIEDPLTKIANRRHIETVLESELKRSERTGSRFSLVMLDVDHFKSVNDTYGHVAGDAALVLIANAVKKAMRGSDFVGRIGGEEFCAILPDTDLDGAKITAERMRMLIEEDPLIWQSKQIPLTASFGVVTYQGNQVTSSDLFKRADEAMYRAKNDGRNRVVLAA